MAAGRVGGDTDREEKGHQQKEGGQAILHEGASGWLDGGVGCV